MPITVIGLSGRGGIMARLGTSDALSALSSCLPPYILSELLSGGDVSLSSVDGCNSRDAVVPETRVPWPSSLDSAHTQIYSETHIHFGFL